MLIAVLCMGCNGLHFRQAAVVGAVADTKEKATRVSVSFEVWDGDQQLTGLPLSAFTVYEDGQAATSESLNDSKRSEVRVPVVLLLDTSYSMYQANAVAGLKQAAKRFTEDLTKNGFEVDVFRFATTIEAVDAIDAIPETFDDEGGERWTSLYAAVSRGFTHRGEGIVVIFSDGADNYSANHQIAGLHEVENEVLPPARGGTGAQRVVHTIAFGNFAQERDKTGIPAMEALERLSANGTIHHAVDAGALDTVFQDVAARIRNVYVFEYLSPNLDGTHTLRIEVSANGATATTVQLTYSADGRLASPSASDESLIDLLLSTLAACEGAGDVACAAADAVRERIGDACREGKEVYCGFLEGESKARQELRASSNLSPAELQATMSACIGTPKGEACAKLNQFFSSRSAAEHAALVASDSAARDAIDDGCRHNMARLCDILWSVERPAKIGVRIAVDSLAVEEVLPGSPAETAGLKPGDVIVAIDGAPPPDAGTDRIGALRGPYGSKVVVTIERGGKRSDITIARE
jgi:hypothetical protein